MQTPTYLVYCFELSDIVKSRLSTVGEAQGRRTRYQHFAYLRYKTSHSVYSYTDLLPRAALYLKMVWSTLLERPT